ncbi:MAG: hypothetical protein P8Y58_09910 [Novosphingobium sp.]
MSLDQRDEPLPRASDANGSLVAGTGSRRGRVTGTFLPMIAPSRPEAAA